MLNLMAENTQRLIFAQSLAAQKFSIGAMRYWFDFMEPAWIASRAFGDLESRKNLETYPHQTARDYTKLMQLNSGIAHRGFQGTSDAMRAFCAREWGRIQRGEEGMVEYWENLNHHLDVVIDKLPKQVEAIKAKFGFHFDNGGYRKFFETDRFIVYQVLPTAPDVEVDDRLKPVLVMHPYVLGPNILAFLPGEGKSYVHCFANQGIPTYMRILKDIHQNPAVQLMTGEDDAMDTRDICMALKDRHGKKITLNGYCQGGFLAVLDILSGELDECVDALITCVAPMDGTRSKALVEYMEKLPPRYRDLRYALKPAASGHPVVDGKVMSWVYKLKSMEKEFAWVTYFRDLNNLRTGHGEDPVISNTAAAMLHWLFYDRTDLPVHITQLSYDSYTIPVKDDGTLPVRLFGRKLNFKDVETKGIRWLICCGDEDDLVDKEAALAPCDYVHPEVTLFPKGHGAIATSWSLPTSACALHGRFTYKGKEYCGPVCFQMGL
ncbi:MAG TPA: hypothetical protein PLR20_10560 [Syntrophales bacterium]|nr:hypothetical protein [Syntrophales bacterium]HOX94380.1 hypothetical protein [Syntrophales bacterium]HPI57790.1 hypothetical protein [Syntrophales bacterium]HPN24971.1 hypothetical protein [Syntrophales bacterium]HQM29781.1 hypothetical protein [Syntrophales bacterium]